ncbi:hypothetical protein ANCCAN_12615 [Ancylostoma caninum]|uniref:G-protein coupled receptors family 1 profile domain-containing protein n=1 Tax=Ancylostoma caninum TaxID=29170 RepID=A0A368GAP5_ANCCA|nr:hypothetical protein ANCCAN_12615 [Ancylostoma caninum]
MMYMTEVLSISLYSVVSMCGILFNSLLIYLVLCKTPKAISTYSKLILNTAICDLVCCVATLLTQERYEPTIYFIHSCIRSREKCFFTVSLISLETRFGEIFYFEWPLHIRLVYLCSS